MLFDAGAAEVHVRISSPPVVSPCFYGIDMADEDELAAAHRSVEEMRARIGATSLALPLARGDAVRRRACRRARVPRLLHARVPDGGSLDGNGREAPVRAGRRALVGQAPARVPHPFGYERARGRAAPTAIAHPGDGPGRSFGYAREVSSEVTYAAAGVSLATAETIVGRLRSAVESTRTPAVDGAFGVFAGLYALDDDRLLAASTDSVGSKLVLGRRAGRLRWCGMDLAAHGINDVLTTGAEPLFFLDYVAANTIDEEQVVELVEGAAEVCRAAGCAILGGETAELPGIYRDEEIDFCGTVVGLVRRSRPDRRVARRADGDVVIGFAVGGDPRQRLLARPAHRRRRPVRRRPPAAADGLLPRPRPGPAGARRRPRARARDRRRDRREPRAGSAAGARRDRRRGLPGSVPPSSAGWPRTASPRTSSAASSTSAIGYCAVVPPADAREDDLVIGRIAAGVDGVVWGDA